MNKSTIISLIESPEMISKDHLGEIRQLTEKFPYSGIIQALYAKGLHNIEDTSYQDQLKLTSVVVSDREKLYHLIHRNKLQELILEIENDIQQAEPVETKMVLDVSKEEIKTTIATTNSTEKKETIVSEEQKETLKDEELAELEKTIISEAISSSIFLEVPEEIENNEITDEIEDVPSEEEDDTLEKEAQKITPSTFSNWFQSTPENKQISTEKRHIPKEKERSIIDSFISKSPAKLSKQEFFSPANIAKMSSVDNEEFVTETLAGVYAAQGNFEKAIRIYERLILKNPEKSTFFASRIRFLKEKLDNKKD